MYKKLKERREKLINNFRTVHNHRKALTSFWTLWKRFLRVVDR